MAEFFHGIEIKDVASKLVVIAQVNAGTIALIGTAPEGPAGMTLVNSPTDAAQFGPSAFDGRTIPHALDAIFAQGASKVIVINCFKTSHLTDVAAESVAIAADYRVVLAHIPVGVPVVTDAEEEVLVRDVDYSFVPGDQFITILKRRTYAPADLIEVTYSWFDKAKVQAADVIGSNTAGVRTGVSLLEVAFSRLKITPKILIAPTYVEQQTVADAMLIQAEKLRARVVIDAPQATTVAGAIEARAADSTYVNFNTGNKRAIGTFPYVYKPNPADTDIDGVPMPYSAYFAGMWANSLNINGLKQSPSNIQMTGFKKLVTEVSCNIGDKTSDASLLSAAGINTVNTGSGIRSWGNRSLAFPISSDINTFMSVLLTKDVVDESIQMASLEFQDKPLDLALIDTIVSSCNAFFNTLIRSKDLIDGEAFYDVTKNTPAQLATGYFIISTRFLPPTAAEHMVVESFIDISLFSNSGLAA
jgi:phage tail sheath protein FI